MFRETVIVRTYTAEKWCYHDKKRKPIAKDEAVEELASIYISHEWKYETKQTYSE